MELGEAKEPQFIELEAPEFLEPGQNFYDQPPFSTILQDASLKTGVKVEALRRMLSRLGKMLKSYDPVKKGEVFNSQNLVRLMQGSGAGELVASGVGVKSEVQRQVFHRIGSKLGHYPYWYEYINTQWSDGFCLPDGSPNTKNPRSVTVKSYAAWADRKLKAEHHLITKGIEEVFPQDFAGQTPLVPTLPGKSSAGGQKWRILKASNLVKESK